MPQTRHDNKKLVELILKKLQANLQIENEKLSKKIAEQEKKESDYQKSLKRLSAQIQEYELMEKLDSEHPSETYVREFDAIDAQLGFIDRNLDEATGDRGQDNFLEKVIAKNREFFYKAEECEDVLEKVAGSLKQFRATLLSAERMK